MAIIDLQRGIAEAGRIRIGHQVPTGGGRTRPEKLGTFRLTSPDKLRIEEAAGLFGGDVAPWAAPAGPQWEVVTKTAVIDVIVPPQAMAFSQYLELWSGGGCQRRCDGRTELLTEQPCLCDPENRECDFHTRLSVMIRDLPGLALWRLDTQGWYAARELAGAVEILTLAAGRGILLPARLLLEQRSVKRPGKDGRSTLRFAVPRLDPGITPGELLMSGQAAGLPLAAVQDARGLPEGRPNLTPVPRIDAPAPTIAAQSAPPPARPARRNAAPEIPTSGRQRAAGRAPAKAPGDEGYWQARAFADGAERGIDADRMRAIAAARAKVPIADFSMSTLDEGEWEQIHAMVVAFTATTPEPRRAGVAGQEDDDALGGDGGRHGPTGRMGAAPDAPDDVPLLRDAGELDGSRRAPEPARQRQGRARADASVGESAPDHDGAVVPGVQRPGGRDVPADAGGANGFGEDAPPEAVRGGSSDAGLDRRGAETASTATAQAGADGAPDEAARAGTPRVPTTVARGLTADELTAALEDLGVSLDYAREFAKTNGIGTVKDDRVGLTATDRLALVNGLRAEETEPTTAEL